jgi:hypothetical protein
MGLEKDRQIEADDDWRQVCKAKGWVCAHCHQVPTKDEYAVYKQTGLCRWCAHTLRKDD